MSGYHAFFVANGEKAPSGKLRDDAIKEAVLEHLWKQLEEDRVEKLLKKAVKKNEVQQAPLLRSTGV
jgi:chorismate mutase